MAHFCLLATDEIIKSVKYVFVLIKDTSMALSSVNESVEVIGALLTHTINESQSHNTYAILRQP